MPMIVRRRSATMIVGIAIVVLLFVGWSIYVARTFRGTPFAAREMRLQNGRSSSAIIAPPVEPLLLRDMTMDEARAVNERVPFVAGPVSPAAPFLFAGNEADRESATTCLASAAYYEAGDDPVGQQAVVQVVLNRLRHPAYPKTICGVVFQGSERSTGCQFTFTCDGALGRVPPTQAWFRARELAKKALGGFVFATVGTATHYHTDWVVPYWSATLDKIARVHTHLFFRWRGGWGQPGAFRRTYAGSERIDPRIAALVDPGSKAAILAAGTIVPPDGTISVAPPAVLPTVALDGVTAAQLKGNIVRLADTATSEFALQLDPAAFPGSYAIVALNICHGRPVCTVMGWARADRIPTSLPVKLPALRSASFLYRRNAQAGSEQVHWNCQLFPRDDQAQCLPGTGLQPSPSRNDDAGRAL